jgi:predicted HicB family RNase H-like nuclease
MGSWRIKVKDKQKKSTDVRFRLEGELHESLKEKAKKEERSMNYLMNKAVELLLTQESAKA